MSGHSKWATTKRAKAAVDAKRSSLFTKLSKNITVAAREGADPTMNFKLRMAIDKARTFNMPKDNIERAVARGAGSGDGANIETVLYEIFAPGGVAIIAEALTDNKNRTSAAIKGLLNKYSANMGGSGSVLWMFSSKGRIVLDKQSLTEPEELKIIEAGAEDILREEEISVITSVEDLQQVKEKLYGAGFEIKDSEITYLPKEKIKVEDQDKLTSFLDALDEDDDINNIYTNADI